MSNKYALIKDEDARNIVELHKDFFESENISVGTNISVSDVRDILSSPKYKNYIEKKETESNNKEDKSDSKEGLEEATSKEEVANDDSENKSDKPQADNVFSIGQISEEEAEEQGLTKSEGENSFWNNWAKENNKTIEESTNEEGVYLAKFFNAEGDKHEASIRESQNKETGRRSIDVVRNQDNELPKEEYFDAVVKRVINLTEENNKEFNREDKPLVIIKADVSPEFKEELIKACAKNNVSYKDMKPKENENENENENEQEEQGGTEEEKVKPEKTEPKVFEVEETKEKLKKRKGEKEEEEIENPQPSAKGNTSTGNNNANDGR